jgi:DUF4097 and DUF4098 domain-containing protein YvlB
MKPIALIAPLLLAAALPAAAQRRSEDYQSRVDTTVAFDRRGTVTLTIGDGEIIVTTWDQERVRIRATSERGDIRLDASPARIALEVIRNRGSDARFEITVPAGVRVSARASNGDISITGVRGGADAVTQSGDIRLDDIAELTEARSLSGDITVRRVAGPVEISTVNGDVSVSDVRGDVEATSVSGEVGLRNIVARYIRGRSTSGDMSYEGAVDPAGRYEFVSHSGEVYLTIPQNTGALLTLGTYSGSIESDFPITLKPGDQGGGRRFTFEIGKGDARITADSFSGDITIRTTPRPPSDR